MFASCFTVNSKIKIISQDDVLNDAEIYEEHGLEHMKRTSMLDITIAEI